MAESIDYSEEEVKTLVDSFKAMGVKPKADTPEALKAWMTDLVASGLLTSKVDPVAPTVALPPHAYIPKLSYFSGTSKDTDYDLWKYEVQCLVSGHLYADGTVLQAIRRAVKGEAARVLMNMGLHVSVNDMLNKFDSCFGLMQEGQTILAAFYNARQAEGEDVATFANRLEQMCHKAMQLGKVHPSRMNEMLISTLQAGINRDLRVLAGVKFELCKDFDTLRVELRKMELECVQQKEHCRSTTTKTAPPPKDPRDAAIDRLTGMMKDMQKDINDLKSSSQPEQQHPHVFAQQPLEQQQQQRGRGQQQFNNFQPRSRSFSRAGQHRPQFDRPQFDRPQPPTDPQYEESCNFNGDIICYRCGQVGHVQYGCRVILDHQRRGGRGRYGSSNYRGLMGRGRP